MDFKERLAKVTKRNRAVKHRPNTTWPLEKRIEVVGQWLILGNMRTVAALTGVSYDLVREWKQKPWWGELEAEIRASENIGIDTKLTKIIDKSLDATLDRVENGDFIYDQKSGEVRRKPVALRDVHKVAIDTLGKREVIRGNQSDRGESTKISVDEHLKMLANEMAKWFEKEAKPVIELNSEDVTDVTEKDIDAVHDQRETGLQEGESAVQQSSGRSEEARGAEQREASLGERGSGQEG